MNRLLKRYIIVVTLVLTSANQIFAQSSVLKSQFYDNPFLVNASMAGYDGRTQVFINYANQWNKIEGAPVMASVSGSLPITKRASIGANVISDKAGILNSSKMMGSFAYQIPFSQDHHLRLGVSIAIAQDRIDLSKATNSYVNDILMARYNDNDRYVDGNFGLTYSLKNFQVQFSYLSLNRNRFSQLSTANSTTIYSSVSYQFQLDQIFSTKPMITYRGIANRKNEYDLALETKANDLHLYTMYHTNKSFSGGIGYTHKQQLLMSFFYNTEPPTIRGYTGGVFDLVLGYRFK